MYVFKMIVVTVFLYHNIFLLVVFPDCIIGKYLQNVKVSDFDLLLYIMIFIHEKFVTGKFLLIKFHLGKFHLENSSYGKLLLWKKTM